MRRTACVEPQCLYKGALCLTSVPVQGCTLPYLIARTRVHFALPQCLYKGCTLPYLSACTRVHFTLPQCLYKGALYLYCLPRTEIHITNLLPEAYLTSYEGLATNLNDSSLSFQHMSYYASCHYQSLL
jgi:hypothetical protein